MELITTETLTTISTVAGTIISYIASKKYIFPYIVKAYEWLKNRKKEQDKENIDSSKELLDIKEKSNDVYENQLEFTLSQIDKLQKLLNDKQTEINEYINQLSSLRKQLVELQKELTNEQLKNNKLSSLVCYNSECKCRQICIDKDK
nr:hypothetical protein [uncultured Bacteroides sp.]